MFYFYDIDGVYLGYAVGGRPDVDTDIVSDVNMLPSGTKYVTVDLGNTYYYEQSGTSHKYETTWMGPYLALDMEYMINDDNNVVAGVEFGLPVYDSKGDQPYRFDWEHPTSVEDKGEFGDAYHLGFNAAWKTRVSDNVGFTLGLTYDYYKVSGATATTYYNRKYYTGIVDALEDYIEYLEDNGAAPSLIAAYQDSLADAEAVVNSFESIGWKSENKDEIESIYKSMDIRLGIEVKF